MCNMNYNSIKLEKVKKKKKTPGYPLSQCNNGRKNNKSDPAGTALNACPC